MASCFWMSNSYFLHLLRYETSGMIPVVFVTLITHRLLCQYNNALISNFIILCLFLVLTYPVYRKSVLILFDYKYLYLIYL